MKREELFKVYSSLKKETIEAAISCDPSSTKEIAGKYTRWVLELAKKGKWSEADGYETKKALEKFHKAKHILPEDKRDIGKFNSVYDLLKSLPAEKIKSRSETRKKGAEKVYEDDKWLIVIPHTKEAAQLYGKGTKWCTSAVNENMFEEYYEDADLYININKKTGRKYQLFFMSKEYRDDKNRKIKIDRFIEKTLNKGAREYYKTKTIYKQLSNGLEFDIYDWWFEVSELKKLRSIYPLVNNSDEVSLFNEKGKQIIDFSVPNKTKSIRIINKNRFIIHEPERLKVVDKKGECLAEIPISSDKITTLEIIDSNYFVLGLYNSTTTAGINYSIFNVGSCKFEVKNQKYYYSSALVLKKEKQKPEAVVLLTDTDTDYFYLYSPKTKELVKEMRENIDCIGCCEVGHPNKITHKNLGKNFITYTIPGYNRIAVFNKKSRNFVNQKNDQNILENCIKSIGIIDDESKEELEIILIQFSKIF